jgi:hypothetical protein
MPIDTSMYNALGVRPKSMMDYEQEYAQQDLQKQHLQRNALLLQSGQMEQAEKQRAIQEQGVLRNALAALRPGASYDDRINALEGTNLPAGYSQADAIRKALLEQRKSTAAAVKDEAEVDSKKLADSIKAHEFHVQKLGALGDPQSALAWAQEGLQAGIFTPEQYQRGVQNIQQAAMNPQTFAKWKQQALQGGMSATQQLQAQHQQAQLAEAARHNTATERTAAGQLGVAQGNLGVRRAELEQAKSAPKGVYDPARGVLVDPRTGEARPVTGPDGKPLGPKEAMAKPLPQSVLKQITEARDNATTIDRLSASFKPEYAGKGLLGLGADMQLSASGNLGVDKDSVEWWKNYRKQAELVERHALFGAALTPTEQGSWRSADIAPGLDAAVVARNLATRNELAKKVFENTQRDLVDAGHNEERIGAIAGRGKSAAPAADGPIAGAYSDAEKERRYQEWKAKQK